MYFGGEISIRRSAKFSSWPSDINTLAGPGWGGAYFHLQKPSSGTYFRMSCGVFGKKMTTVFWGITISVSAGSAGHYFYITKLHTNTPHTPTTTLRCFYSLIIRDMPVLVHICLLTRTQDIVFPKCPETTKHSFAAHQNSFVEASTSHCKSLRRVPSFPVDLRPKIRPLLIFAIFMS